MDAETCTTNLQRCPVCHYSLHGMPVAHHCPECWFEYDEKTRVWEPSAALIRRTLFVVPVMVLFGFFPLLLDWKLKAPIPLFVHIISPLIFISSCLFMIRLCLIGMFVAIVPSGLWFRGRSGKLRKLSWHQLEQMELSQLDADVGSLILPGMHQRLWRTVQFVTRNRQERRILRKSVQLAVARHFFPDETNAIEQRAIDIAGAKSESPAGKGSARGVTHCPYCDYSLVGLPTPYRCPECMFEYDENTCSFKLYASSMIWHLLWVGLTLQLFKVVPIIYRQGPVHPSIVLVFAWVIYFVVNVRMRLYPPFIAFGPREIVIRTRVLGRLLRYPFSELECAFEKDKENEWGRRIVINLRTTDGITKKMKFVFDLREAARCRRHLRRYGAVR